jgi:enoyl-CoA hydratase/carnithine racemase
MKFNDVIVEHREAVSWIYLNRDKALNAISPACMQELRQALEVARDRTETRVLVISGKGRAFCAGADLSDAAPNPLAPPSPEPTFFDYAEAMEAVLNAMPKPVIAAVNGICCGGGLELALMCDFILAAESAKIGDAHANFGAMPGGGATVRLPRVVGINMARYLMFTGDLFPAAEMAQVGLVTRVFPNDQFEAEVQKIAEKIAGKSPVGLKRMKQLLEDGIDMPLKQALQNEKLVSTAHMRSFDAGEGGKAFMAKRKPQFRGY